MITLKVHDFSWIQGTDDDPADQCAHGCVEFRVNNTTFVKPEDGRWAVSAAALFLLRTLVFDRAFDDTAEECNFLFPCCGFNVFPNNGRFKITIPGCPNGVDVNVHHQVEKVLLSSPLGNETVSESEWKSAVLGFVSQVRTFYNANSSKKIIKDDFERRGWELFWEEWNQRVTDALIT